MYAFLVAKI